MLILFESFLGLGLEFCLWIPTFSSTILFHKFVQVFDTFKVTDLSRKGRGSACTRFALRRAGWAWRAARGGRLPSLVRDVNRRLGLHARRNTNSHLSRRGGWAWSRTLTMRKKPWPRGGPPCSTREHLGRAFQIRDHRQPAARWSVSESSRISSKAFSNSSRKHKPPSRTGRTEASVPTLNSRMLWQIGESRAREPSLPPPSLNWGPAAIYHSGQTGIGSRVAGHGLLVHPWILL